MPQITGSFAMTLHALFFLFDPFGSGLMGLLSPQHTSHSNGRQELSGTRSARTGVRTRGSDEPQQPHVGNYRLLKTIGKGNFAKVKLARHILTGREVRWFLQF